MLNSAYAAMQKLAARGLAVGALALTLAGLSAPAVAAPLAGSVIGNQATATYVDENGTPQTTSSNLVETIVAQVAGVDIEATQSNTAAPGETIYFPHIVTNTGNGNDTYTLATTNNGGTFEFANIVIYADANQDGVPDNFTPITITPNLAPGGNYGIIVAVTVPGTAVAGQTDNVTVTTTSVFNGTVTDANTDTVTVTNNAVINVTKAEDITTGPAGFTPVTITLTYTNTGNTTATNVTLTDALNASFAYVPGSGLWSVSNPAPLTDAIGGDAAGIDYSVTGNTVTAIIASVAPGQSGFVRFQVSVIPAAPAGTIPNLVNVSYLDGGGNTVVDTTNTVIFTVTPTVAVDLSDTGSTTDNDGANNDIVTQGPVPQGSTLRYDNVVTNNGNGIDVFNVTFANVSFPAGTSFQLLQADGVTPLTDSNGDGTPDTGPLAPGASTSVFLRVVLPSGATGVGPFDVTKTATSTTDPNVFNTTTDRLTAIATSTVDLTNTSAGVGAPGAGLGPEAAPVTTVTVNPGETASFALFANNTSTVPDSYTLAASTDPTFATLALPAGWTVVFRNASNGVITSTPTIAAGGNFAFTAQVLVPAGNAPVAAPGQSVYFRLASAASGALDIKNDAVVVNAVRDIAITPNNTGQGFPGGAVQYTHTLTINSNVAETAAALTTANSTAQWTSVIYYDANGNGLIDATDPVIDDIADIDALVAGAGLAPGTSYPLIVQVFVPAGAAPGASNTTAVNVAPVAGETNVGNNAANDVTTVVTGDVRLLKTQALDAACDGTADTAFITTPLANAVPGACLVYRVLATNAGSTPVTALVISDTTPALTTYEDCAGACVAVATTGTVTTPLDGGTGQVVNTVGPLAPAGTTTLTFTVRINP
ncbi:hypothetical protein [Nevskia sp.]|uniref:beta strand repeat-containing protein n=1 Tax=Nevskia sp. TaxID=1929292 RepID=UPI0025F358C7|nr:hypothetical protein [Nevskia sp.]